MSSIVELEEQLSCMEREVEEQLDALKNMVWSVSSSINKSADFYCDALESQKNNAHLKVMEVFTGLELDVRAKVLMEDTTCIKRFEIWKKQQAANTEELKRLHTEIHYKAIMNQLDQCRAEIKDYRVKKSRKQHELTTLRQNSKVGQAKMMTSSDNLARALDALRIAISEEEKELSTVPVLIDDEDSSYLIWPAPEHPLIDLNEPART